MNSSKKPDCKELEQSYKNLHNSCRDLFFYGGPFGIKGRHEDEKLDRCLDGLDFIQKKLEVCYREAGLEQPKQEHGKNPGRR